MEQPTTSKLRNRGLFAAAAVLLIAGVVLTRWPWLEHDIWNLDEGSTMTMAQQILAGDVLYRDAIDNRSPLVPYVKAAVFAVFGDWNAFAVHTGLAVALGFSGVLLGWIGLRLGGRVVALATGLAFVVLQFSFVDARDSMSAHTEWFVLVFSTLAFALLIKTRERPSFVAGLPIGLLFGLSTLSKQPGVLDYFVASIALVFLAVAFPPDKKVLLRWWAGMTTTLIAVLIGTSIYFAYHGAHDDYIFYAFTFNTQIYVPEYPLSERLLSIQKPFDMARFHVPTIGLIAFVGALLAIPHTLRRTMRPAGKYPLLPLLALGWFCAGLVSATLGGRGFAHYSATLIPSMSLLFGWIVGEALQKLHRRNVWLSVTTAAIVAVLVLTRFAYRQGEIAETLETADHGFMAKANAPQKFTTPAERIFIWGYAPEIYFYSQRLPATRFVYTNYVTGLLPWTNIDPLRDISYGITPRASEFLTADFAESMPAFVVDTRSDREYSRFPIAMQEEFWPKIVAHYAEVAMPEDPIHGSRNYRLLSAPRRNQNDEWAVSSELRLSGFHSHLENEPPQLEVRGPSGFAQLSLVINGEVTASLPYPTDEQIGVRFFIPDRPLQASRVTVRAEGPKGSWESEAFDFAHYARMQSAEVPAGPVFEFGSAKKFPLALYSKTGPTSPFPDRGKAWHLNAPARVEFDYPAGLSWISFHHGLNRAILELSDGYDLALNWIGMDGSTERLWQRRNGHGSHQLWQEPQVEVVELPPLAPGKLELIFTHGRFGNFHHDRLFLGPILGETGIPFIAFGEDWISADFGDNPAVENLTGHGPGRWQLPLNREISWSRPEQMKSVKFEFGVDDAFLHSDNGVTTGFEFSVYQKNGNAEPELLFNRRLDPINRIADRGPQRAHIQLPKNEVEQLTLIVAGDSPDTPDSQHTWVGNFRGLSVGPAFELEPGYFLNAISAEGHDSLWGDQPHPTRWNAHPPQKVVYPKPRELRQVTVRYGMFDEAIRVQGGATQTDGVTFIVEFKPVDGETRELFRRDLNPFQNPQDRGEQESEIALPLGFAGEFTLRVESRNSASWDWAYWGKITGQTTRADHR